MRVNTSVVIPAARPLPKGSVISYWDEVATVVNDRGDSRIVVNDGVTTMTWFWTFADKSCKVHSIPD